RNYRALVQVACAWLWLNEGHPLAQLDLGDVPQVEEVDQEVRDDRAREVAGPEEHRAEQQPGAERAERPGQVPGLGPDVEQREERARAEEPDRRQQRAAEEHLFADRRGGRQDDDLR